MLKLSGVEAVADAFGGGVKGRRVVEAIQRSDLVLPEVTFSLGDSLTYRSTTRPDCPVLTGHRRYLEVRAVVDGRAVFEVAPLEDLSSSDDYDDLSDRQHFTGRGAQWELGADEVLVVAAEEAIRDVLVEGRMVVLRVTVECR
ncbi:MAG: hypothetical protein QM779_15615 [Propionicimonas sp.]|uniref:hypothetical protein n=1 Tax=Propionicimonas sp. TaxID=1955623 RepID=UPI003D0A51CE